MTDATIGPRPPVPEADCGKGGLDSWNVLGTTEEDMVTLIESLPANGQKTLAIMPTYTHPGWYYGAANFNLPIAGPDNWKFVRSIQEIIDVDLFHQVEARFCTLDRIILGPDIYEELMDYPGFAKYHSIIEFRESII